MALDYIHTGEGRIRVKSNYTYDYYLKDHLGNTRVVFADTNSSGIASTLQLSDYYPFGMTFKNPNQIKVEPTQYLYNGKELQEDFGLNLSDYGARMYDPSLGRWHCVDPLGELFYNKTPYGYVSNNPISRIDPTGMADTDIFGRNKTDENGVYIAPMDRQAASEGDGPTIPNYDPLSATIGAIKDWWSGLFLEEEELPDGRKVMSATDGVKALGEGPVAYIVAFDMSTSVFGGISLEPVHYLIITEGNDKGVYNLTDLCVGGSNGLSLSASGKFGAVFTRKDNSQFVINDYLGNRLEVNAGGSTIGVGGFQGFTDGKVNDVFGVFLTAGAQLDIAKLAKFKLGTPTINMNYGQTTTK
jgi:RHS repeat-associated protein